ncbi:unnamed protein product [Closterium sp. NIES-64]|nr:unnamed protein product [Closterium sp. NIES-64]
MEHLHRPTRSHPFLHSSTSRSLFHSPSQKNSVPSSNPSLLLSPDLYPFSLPLSASLPLSLASCILGALLSQLLSLPLLFLLLPLPPRREGAAAQESGSLTGEGGRERAAVQEQSSTQSSEGSEVAAACEGRRTLSCEGRAGAAAREESSQPMAGQSAAALARACLCAADVVLRVDVVLRGYSGYNTRWALFLLPKLFPKGDTSIPPPALVTVFFGANDAALPGRTSGKQHVPIPEFKENLRVIVTHLQSLGPNVRVVLITPPPVDEPGRMEFAKNVLANTATRTNEFTGKYAGAVREVAEACGGVPVIDLWTVLQQQPTWQALLSDGLHLAPGGNKVLFEQLSSLLQSSADWTPPLVQESMPWDFPEHINIDGENPGNAFKDF